MHWWRLTCGTCIYVVCSAAYTSYSNSHLDCMVVHSSGGGAGGGGGVRGGGSGCTAGGAYAGATFCNLHCVVVVVVVVAVVGADKVAQKRGGNG